MIIFPNPCPHQDKNCVQNPIGSILSPFHVDGRYSFGALAIWTEGHRDIRTFGHKAGQKKDTAAEKSFKTGYFSFDSSSLCIIDAIQGF